MSDRAERCPERYGAVLVILLLGPSVADACSMPCPSGLEMSDLSVHLDGEASVLQLQLNDYGLNDWWDCGPSLATSLVSFEFESGTLSITAGLQGQVPALADTETLPMSNVEVTFDEKAATVFGEYGELIFQLPDLGSTTPIWWYSASLCVAAEVCNRMLAP